MLSADGCSGVAAANTTPAPEIVETQFARINAIESADDLKLKHLPSFSFEFFEDEEEQDKVANSDKSDTDLGNIKISGQNDVSRPVISGDLTIKNGETLFGTGTIVGNVNNESGFMRPGNSPGAITIVGDLSLDSSDSDAAEPGDGYDPGGTDAVGRLEMELGGTDPDIPEYDQINVTGKVTLGGMLNISLIPGFVPQAGDRFEILTYGSVEGNFENITGRWTDDELFFQLVKGEGVLALEVITPFYSAASAESATDFTLAIEEDDSGRTLLLKDSFDSELASMSLDTPATEAISVIGSDDDDTFFLDIDLLTLEEYLPFGVAFAGGLGSDTLQGPDASATFNVFGLNSGSVTNPDADNLSETIVFSFDSVERLIGGGASDIFSISAEGSLTNGIEGGDSEDALNGPGIDADWIITGEHVGSIDTFVDFTGIEILIAGDGKDTLDYTSFTSGVAVDLDTGEAEGEFLAIGFDRVIGTEQGDMILGDQADETFESGPGDDTLLGGLGDDTYKFFNGWGTDVVSEGVDDDSGEGTDTLDFSAVTFDLLFAIGADGALTVSDGGNQVTAVGVDNLIGGQGLNTLDFSAYEESAVTVNLELGVATLFESIAGFDDVVGTILDDILLGNSGVNRLQAGAGNDLLSSGGGNDTLEGGAGLNLLVEQLDADQTLTNTNLTIGGATVALSGIELAELSGGAHANTLDASAFTGLNTGILHAA